MTGVYTGIINILERITISVGGTKYSGTFTINAYDTKHERKSGRSPDRAGYRGEGHYRHGTEGYCVLQVPRSCGGNARPLSEDADGASAAVRAD